MDYIERYLESQIASRLFKGKAIMLYGPRQCGKSTLMKHLITKQGLDPIILTGDDDMDAALFETVTMSRWDQILGTKKTVFIDEGQKIKNLGKSIKLLVDARPEIQVLVTGSSSFSIAEQTQEPLTGRKYAYRLFPMSYGELSNHFGYSEELKALEIRLVFGSYPEIVAKPEQKEEHLTLLAESYLYRDLLQYDGIRKPQILTQLLKALAYQCGSEVSSTELASLLSVSRTLVESYLMILQQAFIIFPLSSYSTNQRNELRKGCKYYFWDNGIRNAILKDFTPLPNRKDIGALWENYLVSERIKANIYIENSTESYFWRTRDQMEVDYLETNMNKVSAFEFTWNAKKQGRVTKAFTNRYPEASVRTLNPKNYDTFLRPEATDNEKP
ncbi:ATP-binding protein [uncultured Sphaerochaeta sp.]|uniref:ATP-binding protein n=1 Tax=uncultured Sphaerochaeta sp. TaxID=886478 RepID=UPI002A0A6B85|nr:ATP-binding protein [uncultured Sphaerochaeta sp.]